ncbi:MAG: hypothetical protein FK733_12925 [Asgard group archaeon]|nr:hypothetical protein [Asgard group archaeon]
MTPKKKQKRRDYPRKRKHGTWFTVGQIIVILGAVLMIVIAIVDLIFQIASNPQDYAISYTFGQINPYLGIALAIVMGALILWLSVDRRIYNRMKIVLYALLIIVLAVIGGNIGALVVIIGGLILIFYRLSKE